ncbi:hypothetical protein [Aquipuribacter sp. SD81]|uniref:hypothetical protein n=1 Tax=Aquipuribacter sp. SD81 TaxID=3127703 RepID=UPI00301758FF
MSTSRTRSTLARRAPAVVAVAAAAVLGLAGCGDDVVDDGVEQEVEDAGEDVEQGVEDAGEDVEDAGEDVEQEVEEESTDG